MDEQNLQELVSKLTDLIKVLDAIGNKGFEKQTEKLIAAIGLLSTQISSRSKNDVDKQNKLDAFIKEVDKATKVVKENTKQEEEAAKLREKILRDEEDAKKSQTKLNIERAKEAKQQSTQYRATMTELQSFGGITGIVSDKLTGLGKNAYFAEVGLSALSTITKGAGAALKGFSSSLIAGDFSAASTVNSLNKLGYATTEMAATFGVMLTTLSVFGPGGLFAKGIKLAIGAAATAASYFGSTLLAFQEEEAKQLDKLFGSYRQLSAAGVILANGLSGTRDTLHALGMSAGQIETFNKVVGQNARTMVMLGSSAGQGAAAFSKVAGTLFKSDIGRSLDLLGVSQEEQAELTAINLRIMARSSTLQLQNNKQIEDATKQSAKFSKEITGLAELTGMQRAELAKAIDAQLADSRLRSAMVDAELKGDTARLKFLQHAQKTAGVLEAAGETSGAAGIREMAATGGATVSEHGAYAAMSGLYDAFLKGSQNDDLGKTLAGVTEAIRRNQNTMAGIIPFSNDIATLAPHFAKTEDSLLLLKPLVEKIQKLGSDVNQTSLMKVMEEVAREAGKDKETTAMVDSERLKKEAAIYQDQIIKTLGLTEKILAESADAFNSAAKEFAAAVNKMKDKGYAKGGISSGPRSGYPVELHGTEAVVPLPDGKSIPVTMSGVSQGNNTTKDKSFDDTIQSLDKLLKMYDSAIKQNYNTDAQQIELTKQMIDSIIMLNGGNQDLNIQEIDKEISDAIKAINKSISPLTTLSDKDLLLNEKQLDATNKIADTILSIKEINKLLKENNTSVNKGLAFSRNDDQLTISEKTLVSLQQIRDLLTEATGGEVPTWEFGSGQGSYRGGASGGFGGGALDAVGGGLADYNNASSLSVPNGGVPGKSLPADEMKQKTIEAMKGQGITDPKAIANIMAQIQHESGFRPRSEEVGKYSPERLFEMYGKGNKAGNKVRFQTVDEAKQLVAQGPEAVGNKIYGGRMGNAADEGFKYRGRGMIQLTGKDNYAKYGKMIGVDLVGNPDLANDPDIATQLAVAYFKDKEKRGTDLTNISSVGAAVGYAGGDAETAKRAKTAQGFMSIASAQLPDNVPKAAMGGILSGPKSGFPAELHGTEAVVPLPDGKTIPVNIQGLDSIMKLVGDLPITVSKSMSSIQDNIPSINTITQNLSDIPSRISDSIATSNVPSIDSITQLVSNMPGMMSPVIHPVQPTAAPNLPMQPQLAQMLGPLVNNIQPQQNMQMGAQNNTSQLVTQLTDAMKTNQGNPEVTSLLQQLVSLQQTQNASIVKLIQTSTA